MTEDFIALEELKSHTGTSRRVKYERRFDNNY